MTAHTASSKERLYAAIDLKSFYASVECMDRGLDPLTTNLVVADKSRTEKTICLAVYLLSAPVFHRPPSDTTFPCGYDPSPGGLNLPLPFHFSRSERFLPQADPAGSPDQDKAFSLLAPASRCEEGSSDPVWTHGHFALQVPQTYRRPGDPGRRI